MQMDLKEKTPIVRSVGLTIPEAHRLDELNKELNTSKSAILRACYRKGLEILEDELERKRVEG